MASKEESADDDDRRAGDGEDAVHEFDNGIELDFGRDLPFVASGPVWAGG